MSLTIDWLKKTRTFGATGHISRMGGRDGFQWGSCLGIGLLLSSIVVNIQAQTPGFISIDCGSTAPSSDALTTFSWEDDGKYTSTGLSGTVPITVSSTLDNSEALKTFRYFLDDRSKHCYGLPTSGNTTFLLRAMFLHGTSPELTLPINFNVALNGTILFPVQYNSSNSDALVTPVVYEGIFQSPGHLTHFCLVSGTGVPFISSLELREFDPQGLMYSDSLPDKSMYLENKWRINCGAQLGSPTIRYPDDPFDRLWQTPGDWGLVGFQSSTGNVSRREISDDGSDNKVPLKVLQDAWLNDTANSSFGVNFPGTGSAERLIPFTKASVNFYHHEIESNVSSGDRVFDIVVNGDTSWENQTSHTGVWLDYSSTVDVPDEWVNFTITAQPKSKLGPILSAIEIYAQYLFNDSATAAGDVEALASLQASFSLTDWQGDPCYPVSWEWVSCTGDTPARVQKLSLSNMGINAPIPPTISDLDALTEINLANNSLYGTIPDSLAALQNLRRLALDDNNLSGSLPTDLVMNLGSNLTYLGNLLLDSNSTSTTKKKATNVGLISGATAGGIVGVGVVVGILIWCFCSKTTKPQPENLDHVEKGIQAKKTIGRPSPFWKIEPSKPVDDVLPQRQIVKQFKEVGSVPYETVQIATDNFKEKIGEGSYGAVYHGRLNDREVAVKLNNIQSDQGRKEFTTEVHILTRVHHRNLVSLIGYCNEEEKHILIYEFQVNGTLKQWLQDGEKSRGTLDWKTRLQIALDAAKGLEYLHKGCDPTIIHRDVKSNNILLDENMRARVADFGLSKSPPIENSCGYSTVVKGTRGYLDPEYQMLERLTHKSDIYSFGVVLAEIITGRLPFEIQTEGTVVILVEFVQKLVERTDIEALADPSLRGEFNPESMWTMADIVLSCTNPVGARRPDMTQVVSSITEAINIEKTFATHSPLAPSRSFSLPRSITNLGYNSLQ